MNEEKKQINKEQIFLILSVFVIGILIGTFVFGSPRTIKEKPPVDEDLFDLVEDLPFEKEFFEEIIVDQDIANFNFELSEIDFENDMNFNDLQSELEFLEKELDSF